MPAPDLYQNVSCIVQAVAEDIDSQLLLRAQ